MRSEETMIYEIQSKSDFSTGATLVVRIPEDDFDHQAFYTVERDWPSFLLPFRCHSVDGQVECTYHLGAATKLQYRFGSRSAKEYIEFWKQILLPLLECDDWFLQPYSFVLDPAYLYIDREAEHVLYVYIPTKKSCGGAKDLRDMVAALARQNPATEHELENMALRAIMEDFRPKEFLQMIKGFDRSEAGAKKQSGYLYEHPTAAEMPMYSQSPVAPQPIYQPVQAVQPPAPQPVSSVPQPEYTPVPRQSPGGPDDIVIEFDDKKKKDKKTKKEKSVKEKKEKPVKEKKEKPIKEKKGWNKKEKGNEILLGAEYEEMFAPKPAYMPQSAAVAAPAVSPVPFVPSAHSVPPVVQQAEEYDDVTQLEDMSAGARLRLVGAPTFPSSILVTVASGRPFTIGRFDVSVGHQQSDFEFDKKSRGVSRHHAVIERDGNGNYWLIDLSSTAGTFVGGKRLTPNVPEYLQSGCTVSFGTSGADYIWEC